MELSWLSDWRVGLKILCARGTGLIPGIASYLVWYWGKWCEHVSSARNDPALNGYLEKSGVRKQEGCSKAQEEWPPTPIAVPG